MPARLPLLGFRFRSSWLTVEGGRGRRRHSAASPGRTGSCGRVDGRGCWRSRGAASGSPSGSIETAASRPKGASRRRRISTSQRGVESRDRVPDLSYRRWSPRCASRSLVPDHVHSAWTVIIALAHNLGRWSTQIGLPNQPVQSAHSRRRHLLRIPARLTRTSRQWTLRMPARWPWQNDFTTILDAIRALPALT